MKPSLLLLPLLPSTLLAAPLPLKRTTESSAASTDALAQILPDIALKRNAEAEPAPQDPTALVGKVTGLLGGVTKRDAEADAEPEPQDPTALVGKVTGLLGGVTRRHAEPEPQDPTALVGKVTSLLGGVTKREASSQIGDPTAVAISHLTGGLKKRSAEAEAEPQVPSLPAPVAGVVGKVTGLLGGVV